MKNRIVISERKRVNVMECFCKEESYDLMLEADFGADPIWCRKCGSNLMVRLRKHANNTKEVTKKAVANSKAYKLTIIIGICTYVIYNLIGYILKTDILIPVTVRKSGGSISFVGILLWFVTTLLIRLLIELGKKIYKRKSSS